MDKQQKNQTSIEVSKEDIQGRYENRESLQTLINKYCWEKTNDKRGQLVNPHLGESLTEEEGTFKMQVQHFQKLDFLS